MRLGVLVLTCLLFVRATRADEVEVVEAISGDDNRNQDSNGNNHQDSESQSQPQQQQQSQQPNSSDQTDDSDNGSINQYNSPNHRGHPILPGRGGMPSNRHNVAYHGPPPPPPSSSVSSPGSQKSQSRPQDSIDKVFDTAIAASTGAGDPWPISTNDMPKIVSLDVKCEKNSMKVYLAFDKPFYGIVFSKGHYSNVNCVYLPAGLGRTSVNFEIGIHTCGTAGNTDNGLYGYGVEAGSGTYFENIVVIQYDPQVQEVWDQARKLRCTWHDLYEKSVTFRPFPVDMLDVVRADFAGDNVGCWMQIQVGKGPWASEVTGLVKIGQTMTMVLAIKDDDSKFDMLVRNCMAHDGKRAPIQLVDQRGCITRPKLMSRFTKIKNFGASASVLSYAHFQAFKFPDSMEVHFQCTIQICRYQCPDQCSDPTQSLIHQDTGGLLYENTHRASLGHADVAAYGISPPPMPLETYLQAVGAVGRPRDERRRKSRELSAAELASVSSSTTKTIATATAATTREKTVGVNRVIRVVSTGDLTFSIDETNTTSDTSSSTMIFPIRESSSSSSSSLSSALGINNPNLICMTTSGFTFALLLLISILLGSCGLSVYLCVRLRPFRKRIDNNATSRAFSIHTIKPVNKSACFYS